MFCAGVVDRHDLGELDQGALGRAIGGAPALPTRPSCEAIKMIDPPPPAIIWGSAARLSRNDAGQVDVEHPLPIGEAGLDDRAARIMRRRAVHENVEPAEGLVGRLGDGAACAAFAGDVAGLRQRLVRRLR